MRNGCVCHWNQIKTEQIIWRVLKRSNTTWHEKNNQTSPLFEAYIYPNLLSHQAFERDRRLFGTRLLFEVLHCENQISVKGKNHTSMPLNKLQLNNMKFKRCKCTCRKTINSKNISQRVAYNNLNPLQPTNKSPDSTHTSCRRRPYVCCMDIVCTMAVTTIKDTDAVSSVFLFA